MRKYLDLQPTIDRVALEATAIDPQDRELGYLTPIHQLVNLIRDHAHNTRNPITQSNPKFCGKLTLTHY
jgi:hypothetical protein